MRRALAHHAQAYRRDGLKSEGPIRWVSRLLSDRAVAGNPGGLPESVMDRPYKPRSRCYHSVCGSETRALRSLSLDAIVPLSILGRVYAGLP
jgi:hypothetical protein